MRRIPAVSRAVFLGLLTAQLVATVQVYISNRHLHQSLLTISEAGYLTVPNEHIMHTLCDVGPAFFGGIFFTLTVGAGLSILAASVGWMWISFFKKSPPVIYIVEGLWAGLIILINTGGFSPLVTAYFLFVPPVVFYTTVRWINDPQPDQRWLPRLAPVLAIVLLTVIWASFADRLLFMNIRDYLLLSNPIGRSVDRFYYRYTLYPAQVFKPLEQKTLKTSFLEDFNDQSRRQRVRRLLERYDYLPAAGHTVADLEVTPQNARARLAFKHKGEVVLETSLADFLSHPEKHLGLFSAKVDIYGPFRQATFICLLVGFPVLLYLLVFSAIYGITSFLAAEPKRSFITSVACLTVGIGLLAAVHGGREPIPQEALPDVLESDSWRRRTEGLRLVVQKGLEIGDYPAYRRSLTSAHVPERYWVTKAVGLSRDPHTRADILTLLGDPHPNVVSMAFQAAGNRGNRDWVPEIIRRIKTSRHWYNQWYAYRALKALGWHQGRADHH